MPYRFLEDPGIAGLQSNVSLARGFMKLPNNDYALMLVHYPAFDFMARGYESGHLSTWNPYVGCGTPVDSNPQYKALDPFMGLFYYIPSPWSFWVGLGIEALIGMFGFYIFLRRVGLSPVLSSAWAAFAVFNPWTQQMMMLSSVWSDWLLGWGLLAAWIAARGRLRASVLPGIACALFLFCGHPEEALLLTGVVMTAFLGLALSEGVPWLGIIKRGGVFGVTLAGLSSIYVLPYMAGLPLFSSYKSLWSGIGGYPVGALFNPGQMVWIPPLLWGLASVAFFSGGRGIRPAAALAALGGLIAFKWPYVTAVRDILALNNTLVAIYAQTLFWLGVLWLSVIGSKALVEASRENRNRLARALAYGFGLYYTLSWAYATLQEQIFWPSVYIRAHRLLLGAGLLLLASLYAGRLRPALIAAGTLLLLAIAPSLPMAPYRFLTKSTPVSDPPAVVRFLQDHVAPHGRISGLLCVRPNGTISGYPLLTPNQSVVWGLRDIRISDPYWLSSYAALHRRWATIHNGFTTSTFSQANVRLLSWLGVSYLAVPHGKGVVDGFKLAYSGEPADVWEVGERPSRARMIYSWTRCDDEREAARMSREDFSGPMPEPGIPVSGVDSRAGRPSVEPKWNLRWLEDGTDVVSIRVTTDRPGLLFLADSYHPDWKGFIDGRPCPIYRALAAFRAVAVPAGVHTVTMRYRSNAFLAGAAICAGTALLLVLLGLAALFSRTAKPTRGARDR
jgi:hypothetical protein